MPSEFGVRYEVRSLPRRARVRHVDYSKSQKTYDGGSKAGSALNMVVVGHDNLGVRGFNGDVWPYKGFAYVGHWGFQDPANGHSDFCPSPPNSGVAVLDARDPANPVRIATLQNPLGTSAEDVTVYTARYGPLAGHDIAAAGIQWCGGGRHDPGAVHGLQLWDVTNPAAPTELALFGSRSQAGRTSAAKRLRMFPPSVGKRTRFARVLRLPQHARKSLLDFQSRWCKMRRLRSSCQTEQGGHP